MNPENAHLCLISYIIHQSLSALSLTLPCFPFRQAKGVGLLLFLAAFAFAKSYGMRSRCSQLIQGGDRPANSLGTTGDFSQRNGNPLYPFKPSSDAITPVVTADLQPNHSITSSLQASLPLSSPASRGRNLEPIHSRKALPLVIRASWRAVGPPILLNDQNSQQIIL
ncbi:hypothetical protein PoB_006017200 [Plakobranchus ocellatus]|uniref:Uncharacterized protein n=1 Tax=Plakobranchus ocellatus TaxID=259542 RepID=A0AAV4CP69_9GAST|nr:hypothetical protein PoB_006017200 [Plakobranchus ocellatus]